MYNCYEFGSQKHGSGSMWKLGHSAFLKKSLVLLNAEVKAWISSMPAIGVNFFFTLKIVLYVNYTVQWTGHVDQSEVLQLQSFKVVPLHQGMDVFQTTKRLKVGCSVVKFQWKIVYSKITQKLQEVRSSYRIKNPYLLGRPIWANG